MFTLGVDFGTNLVRARCAKRDEYGVTGSSTALPAHG